MIPRRLHRDERRPSRSARRWRPTFGIACLLLSLAYLLLSCAAGPDPVPARVQMPAAAPRDKDLDPHWPLTPEEAERELGQGRIKILSERYAGHGVTGASLVKIELVDEQRVVSAKWKAMPGGLDGINNSPRKELASYLVQRLFLAPADYVVPTSVARCLPAETFPDAQRPSHPPLRGTQCELGVLSLWLENLAMPPEILDLERFGRDRGYAERLADFNLATYLMKHQDGRLGNILVSPPDLPYRIFAVDNGVAWSGLWYNWFVPNWKHLRVPALRRASVDRLRGVKEADLAYLGIVANFIREPDGMLVPAEPERNLDPDRGVREQDGGVQLGLDDDELEDLFERIEDLIESVDDGKIAVF